MTHDYQIVKLPDVEACRADGWEIDGFDKRYLPSFGSVWMKRTVPPLTAEEFALRLSRGIDEFRKARGSFPSAVLLGSEALAALRALEYAVGVAAPLHGLAVYTCKDIPSDTVLPISVDRPMLARFTP